MRNLKKILALALALVMTLSVMTVANAAFTDSKDIDSKYTEAVDVLSSLGVFKGTGTGSTFSPKQSITRAEVAAIIYRIVTGDVTDKQPASMLTTPSSRTSRLPPGTLAMWATAPTPT